MQQKLILLSIFIFAAILIFARPKKHKPLKTYSFLALGDSYTIGESVPIHESFPYQTVQLLRKKGLTVNAPEIVAKTGWTTDELRLAMDSNIFHPPYDIITLLIGVNNQYRGYAIDKYKQEFESLLQQAIHLAGQEPQHVVVLSIPDWGVTPFAEGRDRALIAKEIDSYNSINKNIAGAYQVHYIDITPDTRLATTDPSLIAGDGLHPSGAAYGKWAEKLSSLIGDSRR